MKHVIKEISPTDVDALEADLKFLYNNRSDHVDQFVEEGIALFKSHLHDAMHNYQTQLLEDMSRHLRNEVLNVIVRSRREAVVEDIQDEWGS